MVTFRSLALEGWHSGSCGLHARPTTFVMLLPPAFVWELGNDKEMKNIMQIAQPVRIQFNCGWFSLLANVSCALAFVNERVV